MHAIANARKVTNDAFAKGTVPAPYYLFLLMRAQRASMPHAVSVGCAGEPGGTVYCQRFTAQHKGPTAVRHAVHEILVPTKRHTANSRTKWVKVATRSKFTVVA